MQTAQNKDSKKYMGRRRKGVQHMGNLYNRTLPAIPDDIREKLQHRGITLTAFEEKNEILRNLSLQQEAGYRKMEAIWYP